MLYTANDWIITYDTSHDPLIFPPHIAQTSLRPDIVIHSNKTRQVVLIELTVPTEDNIIDWHTKKEEKYSKLLDDIAVNKWSGHVYGIEVGSRGYVARSVVFALKKLGMENSSIKSIRRNLSLICLRSSYLIYLSRKNAVWRPWENKSYPKYTKNVHSASAVQDHYLSCEQYDFVGFTEQEIYRSKILNGRKLGCLTNCYKSIDENDDFTGFFDLEVNKAKTINSRKLDILRKKERSSNLRLFSEDETGSGMPVGGEKADSTECRGNKPHKPSNSIKIIGIINLGNTCYMNIVMQCLNSLAPIVDYFKGNAYHADIQPQSKYNGKLANEVCVAFGNMNNNASPVSLAYLKNLIGNFYSPFKGSGQEDAHEFLIKLIELLCEDLGGGMEDIPQYLPDGTLTRGGSEEVPKIMEMLQGTQANTILCRSCHYASSTLETFNVLSLSPTSTNKNVEELLKCAYGDTHIDYSCPKCGLQNSSSQKNEIKKLPLLLIIHLNRFSISNRGIRKNEQYVEFPVTLKICTHEIKYNLKGITNHYGTLNSGHYTSFCKSRGDGNCFKCDDIRVTKMNTSIKTSAAYLLFYELS